MGFRVQALGFVLRVPATPFHTHPPPSQTHEAKEEEELMDKYKCWCKDLVTASGGATGSLLMVLSGHLVLLVGPGSGLGADRAPSPSKTPEAVLRIFDGQYWRASQQVGPQTLTQITCKPYTPHPKP